MVLPNPYIYIIYFTTITALRPVIGPRRTIATRPAKKRGRCASVTTAHEGDKDKYDSKDGLPYDYRIMRPRKDLQRALIIIQHDDI